MIARMEESPSVTHIQITPEERSSGLMSKENIEKAVTSLVHDGVVVLDDAVNTGNLDILNQRMVEEARYLRGASGTQFNYDVKAQNILQHMVPEPEYLFPDVHTNPFATTVCKAMMGPNPVLRYHKANTNFPGESRQPVHCDVHYEHPKVCFSLAVNIVLIDCSPENGSTECWPGSHSITKFADQNGMKGIHQHLLDDRKESFGPPIQPSVKRGGIIIRDMRLWHAGMPNKTEDEVRVMLNLIYFANWYRCPMPILFPKTAKEKIEAMEKDGGVQIAAEYVDELDHMTLKHTHDFGQDDKREVFGRWHCK